jgi:hypothetical protein
MLVKDNDLSIMKNQNRVNQNTVFVVEQSNAPNKSTVLAIYATKEEADVRLEKEASNNKNKIYFITECFDIS